MSGFGATTVRDRGQNIKYDRLSTSSPPPETLPTFDVHEATQRILDRHLESFKSSKKRQLIMMSGTVIGALVFLYWVIG